MKRLWILLFSCFAVFMVMIVILKNTGGGAAFFSFFGQLPSHDKIGHFVLMGTFGFLAVGAFSPPLPWRPWVSTVIVMLVLLLLIGLEEVSQQFLPNRTFSLSDYLFGVVGVLSLGSLAHVICYRWR